MRILDQVDYEYDFFDQKAKLGQGLDDESRYPAAYLKYSRSY
jgi:hypothetical protein